MDPLSIGTFIQLSFGRTGHEFYSNTWTAPEHHTPPLWGLSNLESFYYVEMADNSASTCMVCSGNSIISSQWVVRITSHPGIQLGRERLECKFELIFQATFCSKVILSLLLNF